MFASILPYRREVATDLIAQITAKTLPHALLFAGPSYSGRLTLILEAARSTSCEKGGASHCTCPSCRAFARFGMHNVIFVGTRDHKTRIEAALVNFVELRTEASRRQLLQVFRSMLLQFHAALSETGSQRDGPAFEAAATVDEVLMEVEEAATEEFPRYGESLRALLKPIFKLSKRTVSLSIGQVRSLQEWTLQTSFSNTPRWIILEGVEQSSAGTRNSLLKLLEEPPDRTYIALITEHPSRLLPTILSRVQQFQVRPFSEDEKNQLLSQIFFADGKEYENVKTYMLERSGIPCKTIRLRAQEYLQRVIEGDVLTHNELSVLCDELDEPVRLEYFLDEFLVALRVKHLQGVLTTKESMRLAKAAGEAERKATIFNQNRKLFIESLHYRLQEKL